MESWLVPLMGSWIYYHEKQFFHIDICIGHVLISYPTLFLFLSSITIIYIISLIIIINKLQ